MENTTNENELNQEASAEEQTKTEVETPAQDEESLDKKLANEFREKYLYLAAEMQNMERRFQKEKSNLLKYGQETILNELVDVVDNFERTLGFIRQDTDPKVKNIVIGIDMINKMFLDILSKNGLKQVEALGKEFDPNFHEALSQVVDESKNEMEIVQVHQSGYLLGDRLLRPAKVVVVKNT